MFNIEKKTIIIIAFRMTISFSFFIIIAVESLHWSQILGFESLQQPRWYRKLCIFFKIVKNQSPKYLFELIPTARQGYLTRHKNNVPLFNVKHDYFKSSFFPSTVIEWNKLDSNIRNSESLPLFKKRILASIRPFAKSAFQC